MPMYAIGISERRDNIMADYVQRIRTESGDLQIDYESLANLPQSDTTLSQSGKFADAKATGDKINELSQELTEDINNLSTTVENLTYEDVGALPDTYVPPVLSVNGETGNVLVKKLTNGTNEISINSVTPGMVFTQDGTVVGGMTVDTASGEVVYQKYQNGALVSEDKIYTENVQPEYPVTSVNGKTGAVVLTASDVGAATSSHSHSQYVQKTNFSLSGTTLTITT